MFIEKRTTDGGSSIVRQNSACSEVDDIGAVRDVVTHRRACRKLYEDRFEGSVVVDRIVVKDGVRDIRVNEDPAAIVVNRVAVDLIAVSPRDRDSVVGASVDAIVVNVVVPDHISRHVERPAVVVEMQTVAAIVIDLVAVEHVVAGRNVGAVPLIHAAEQAVVMNLAIQQFVERRVAIVRGKRKAVRTTVPRLDAQESIVVCAAAQVNVVGSSLRLRPSLIRAVDGQILKNQIVGCRVREANSVLAIRGLDYDALRWISRNRDGVGPGRPAAYRSKLGIDRILRAGVSSPADEERVSRL